MELEAEVDHGQIHSTFRLHLRAADAPVVRRLGELIGDIPTRVRIDRFSPPGSQSVDVGRALLKLAVFSKAPSDSFESRLSSCTATQEHTRQFDVTQRNALAH